MLSDMLKALCFMVYPVVELSHGRVASKSAFCQTIGFFLALGIEACDFAVLFIAIHTGLCVSRKRNGLYPYRRAAFLVFGTIPLILVSLAFVNKPAFANTREYCYLPMQPHWTRTSLSWIPRYIIFIIILGTYAWIYVHIALVTGKFARSSEGRGTSHHSSACRSDRRKRALSVPPLPELQRHGLIPTPDQSPRESVQEPNRRTSAFSALASTSSRRASDAAAPLLSAPRRMARAVRWNMPEFARPGSNPGLSNKDQVLNDFALGQPRRASGASTQLVPSATRPGLAMKWKLPGFGLDAAHSLSQEDPGSVPHSKQHSPHERRHSHPVMWQPEPVELGSVRSGERQPSAPTVSQILADKNTLRQESWSSPTRQGEVDLPDHIVQRDMQPRSTPTSVGNSSSFWHRPFTRQSGSASTANIFTILRRGPPSESPGTSASIFLSPTDINAAGVVDSRENIRRQARQLLVYPLVYLAVWVIPFISHLLGEDKGQVPFGLTLSSLLSLCVQGLVDALVFSIRERPWRQSKEQKRNHPRLWPASTTQLEAPNVGRDREEMRVDGLVARRRLRGELEERQSERMEGTRTPPKNWWEPNTVDRSATT